MSNLDSNENRTYYATLNTEYQKAIDAERKFNETLGYGDLTASANRTAMSSQILSVGDQLLKNTLADSICITSNAASWDQQVGRLWADYNSALADYEAA